MTLTRASRAEIPAPESGALRSSRTMPVTTVWAHADEAATVSSVTVTPVRTRVASMGSPIEFSRETSARPPLAHVAQDVIPSGAPQARSRGIAIRPAEGPLYRD